MHVRTNYVSNEAENAKGVGTHWRANAHAERTHKQTTECTGRIQKKEMIIVSVNGKITRSVM